MAASSMPWVKLYTEMLDDVKLARLTPAQCWRFTQLILLAAECDAAGALVTGDSRMTTEDISWRLRSDIGDMQETIDRLVEIGLLIVEDGLYIIKNFANRQGPAQEEKRKQWRERQERRRNRVNGVNVTQLSPVTHADVTPLEKSREEKSRPEQRDNNDDNGSNADFAALVRAYESDIGVITPTIAQSLEDDLKEYGLTLCVDAISEAAKNNVRKLSYIQAILKRWKTEGRNARKETEKVGTYLGL